MGALIDLIADLSAELSADLAAVLTGRRAWAALSVALPLLLLLPAGCSRDDANGSSGEESEAPAEAEALVTNAGPPGWPLPGELPGPGAPRTERIAALAEASVREVAAGLARLEAAPVYTLRVDMDPPVPGRVTWRGTQHLSFLYGGAAGSDTARSLRFTMAPRRVPPASSGRANLEVTAARVDGRAATLESDGLLLTVTLAADAPALVAGAEVVVEMDLEGAVPHLPAPEDASGAALVRSLFGRGEEAYGYGSYGHADGIVNLHMFHPVLVPELAPERIGSSAAPGEGEGEGGSEGEGEDEDPSAVMLRPGGPGSFDVSVRAPRAVKVVASGSEIGRGEDGESRITRFAAAGAREVMIQLSRRYVSRTARVKDVVVRAWFSPEHRVRGERVLEHARDAVRLFERELGPYPYKELDVVEAPLVSGAGGVASGGLVTVAAWLLGDPPGTLNLRGLADSPLMSERLEFVVAHEVAHQWWGMLVASDRSRHAFLDEAMANASAVTYFDRLHGRAAGDRQRDLQLRVNYRVARGGGAQDRPIVGPVEQFESHGEFSAIIYAKGGLFLDRLRAAVGDAAFGAGLRAYVADRRHALATPKHLLDAISEHAASPEAGRGLAQRWLHGTFADEDIGGPASVDEVLEQLLQDMTRRAGERAGGAGGHRGGAGGRGLRGGAAEIEAQIE